MRTSGLKQLKFSVYYSGHEYLNKIKHIVKTVRIIIITTLNVKLLLNEITMRHVKPEYRRTSNNTSSSINALCRKPLVRSTNVSGDHPPSHDDD